MKMFEHITKKIPTGGQMKRALSLLLSGLLLMQSCPVPTRAAGESDLTVTIDTGASVTLTDADADGYYDIGTADDLYAFAAAVNSGSTAINGELTDDIVVNENVLNDDGTLNGNGSNFRVWTPIGNRKIFYAGTFDGKGYSVSGLYHHSGNSYVGLFGGVGENGIIRDVGVEKSYFFGYSCIGGVAGKSSGTITNCYSTGAVKGGNNDVGGVVGLNDGSVTNCYNTGAVNGSGEDIGGVVGFNSTNVSMSSNVTNCYNTGTVSGKTNVGGVVGYNVSSVTNCYNIGSVSGSGNCVGGVVGNNFDFSTTVTNCYSTGSVSGTSDVGGVVGYNSIASVTNCCYDSDVYTGSAVGTDSGKTTNTEGKTTAQFASGEVAYLLNGETNAGAWKQDIGVDAQPGFTGGDVYLTTDCKGASVYANALAAEDGHVYMNGFCSGCDTYQPAELNGDGYYEIGSAGQLYWFAALVNGGETSASAILTDDIVVNENVLAEDGTLNEGSYRAWTPIGNISNKYAGTFDGKGCSVSGLYFNNSSTSYVGLFGYISEGGSVSNVGVEDSYLSGNYHVGGVAGQNYGTVTNCYNTGGVSGSNAYVGGVVGTNSSTVTNCYNTGNVSGSSAYVGGVVGYKDSSGSITNCYNTGTVSGSSCVGGVVGRNNGSNATNCYYLTGCATDGSSVTQYGTGSTTADTAGSTTGKTADQFASGEVTYLLQSAQSEGEDGTVPQVWGQNLDNGKTVQATPDLSDATVYYGYFDCVDAGYTNNADVEKEVISHEYDEDGFCALKLASGEVCGAYQPAFLNDNSTSDDTTDDFYIISNAGQLFWFAALVNGGDYDADAQLSADIDLKGREWTTITSTDLYYSTTTYSDAVYTGTFDGKGHVVSNFTVKGISGTKRSVGLFGTTKGATIRGLGVDSMTFELNGAGDVRAAAIVGQMLEGTLVENCFVTNSTLTPNDYIVGGVAACNYGGTIRNCYTYNVAVSGHARCGNLVSDTRGDINSTDRPGTVENCYTDAARVAGTQSGGLLTDCEAGVSDERFASGEIAYKLGGSDGVWKQTIDSDESPNFTGAAVYCNRIGGCTEGSFTYAYSNTEADAVTTHDYSNGFCSDCDHYEAPEGSGTKEDPYQIANAGNLYWFAAVVNSGYDDVEQNTSASAILTDDIVVNEGTMSASSTDARVWTPIGNDSCRYTGTFDGKGCSVSGLYFNDSSASYVGLFGYISANGSVSGVGVENSYFFGLYGIGGVAGRSDGTVANCYNTGTLTGSGNCVGGVAGYNGGPITNCYNTGAVTGHTYIGGVVGINYNTITNCYNTGAVTGYTYIGGMVGYNFDTVNNCCYLTGCATDGSSVTQYGSGNGSVGSTTADTEGCTTGKTTDQFASGEVAYLLGKAFGQNLDNGEEVQNLPVLSDAKVYYGYFDCVNTGYSNSELLAESTHVYSNGFCCGCDAYQPAEDTDNDGVYEIGNAGQLYWFAALVNGGETSAKAILTDDIVVNEGVLTADGTLNGDGSNFRVWTPICNYENQYNGNFDGDGHTVSGLYFNDSSTSYVGLFGCVGGGGSVSGVGVENSYLDGYRYIGGVVGRNYGIVTDCYNTGAVSGTTISVNGNSLYVGGVVGMNNHTVTNCYNTGSVSGVTYVGGVVGMNYHTVANCYNTGSISGTRSIGGVAGCNSSSTVKNCYNSGTVIGSDGYVGGVVGYNLSGTVTNCYYLTGCATDGSDVTQYGIGNNTAGSTTADTEGSTTGKTAAEFASGEVAYLLQGEQTEQIWGQNLDNNETVQATPVLSDAKVYYGHFDCVTSYYTNDVNFKDPFDHDYNDNGFCTRERIDGTICGAYQPAEDTDNDGVYEIGNAGQLFWFAELVNTGTTGAKAVLTDDIDLENRSWTPIGSKSNAYTGIFDGAGCTISNFSLNASGNNQGFFGYVKGGTVKDFTINGNINVVATSKGVGVIGELNQGSTVSGVISYVDITASDDLTDSCAYIAGITGALAGGTVSRCAYYGDINMKAINVDQTAGIVGYVEYGNGGTVKDCGFYGTITTACEGSLSIGGIIGYSRSSKLSMIDCLSVGTITAASDNVATTLHTAFGVINAAPSSISNLYYLVGSVPNAHANSGSHTYTPADGIITAATAEQLASGEVAYKLNGDQSEIVWKQTIGTDAYPGFSGEQVYYGYLNCQATAMTYANESLPQQPGTHSYENGFCTVCKHYEAPAGSGTEDAPYKIANGGNLYWFAAVVNGGYDDVEKNADACAILTTDIVVNKDVLTADGNLNGDGSNFRVWTPIGPDPSTGGYTGTFDGKGYSVSGLYFNDSTAENVGLIGFVATNCSVSNVGVKDSYFSAGRCVGGVAGYNGGTVTNCYNSGTVTGSGQYIGGVAGYNGGTVTNCYNTGTVTGTGTGTSSDYVGGVAGYNDDTVTNCYNTGGVSGGRTVGGVMGYNDGSVTNCYNNGAVSGKRHIGGVTGNNNGALTGCYNTGDVKANGINYVGGVTGENSGTLTGCYNIGDLSASGTEYVGGVAGNNSGTVTGCYNTGKISNTGADYVGGVAGCNTKTVKNSYNIGAVSGGGDYIGGVVGQNSGADAVVTNCYNTGSVKGSDSTVSDCVGGVTGDNTDGTVTNCYNTGTVESKKGELLGGVAGSNSGPVSNCYYDSTVYTGNAIGTDSGTTDKTEGKTTEQFKRGEVAYLLSLGCTVGETTYPGDVWGQNLDNGETVQAAPVFSNATVYPIINCVDAIVGYSNTEGKRISHIYDNGFCVNESADGTVCDRYEAPTGSGTADDPYKIANAGQLYWFAAVVNGGYDDVARNTSACAVLTTDIVVNENVLTADGNLNGDGSNFRAWTPIGNDGNPYTGTFDGDGKTVSGLYFNDPTVNSVGLFGSNSGTVQNVGVKDSYFCAGSNIGGVAGNNYGTMTNCTNSGTVTGSSANGLSDYVGGVVGYNDGTVTNCYNTGGVSGEYDVGGVVGFNSNGTVTNCCNTGAVNGNDYVGGVVGYNYTGGVTNCTNGGTVTGSNDVGGVVGTNMGGTVTNCSNSGTVNDSSNSGTVNDSSNDIGGVAGVNTGTVTNCYNTGTVSGKYDVGGVVGFNSDGTVTNCCNTGAVNGSDYVGGVVGYNFGPVSNCYYDSTVYTGNAVGDSYGTTEKTEGKTTAQFKSGEVAYLLSLGCTVGEGDEAVTYSGDVWGQTIDLEGETPEDVPVLNGAKVYPVLNCSGAASGYSNTEGQSSGHTYVNGFCEGCERYEAPEGSGTADDPYKIANGGNLYWFAAVVNGGYGDVARNASACAVLTTDIVVNENVLTADGTLNGDGSNFRAWTPIGSDRFTGKYTGTFNGSEKTISGLYFNDSTAGYVGLFGGSSGTVQNVGVKDSYFSAITYIGGVVGYNDGTVTNCYNTGTATGSNDYVGGVAGYNSGTVTGCYNTGTVTGSGVYIGGVAGHNRGTVTNCTNNGAVTGGGNNVGGVAGDNSGTVTGCYNTGAVTGSSDYVGGVAGQNVNTVSNCSNSGTVIGSGNMVSGVVGYSVGTVTNCTNTGGVSGSDYAGGVVGFNNGTVTNSYSTGSFTVSGVYVGGVVGYNNSSGPVSNCYYDSTVYTGNAIGAGSGTTEKIEGKTTEQFKSGEVAYLLSLGCTVGETTYPGDVWGQTIDLEGKTPEDAPVLNGEKVYPILNCSGAASGYSNTEGQSSDHTYVNGFCEGCERYEAPEGSGTADDPYKIANGGNLYWFAAVVNGGYDGVARNTDARAILTTDIVVNKDVLTADGNLNGDGSNFRAWTPICNSDAPYTGTFDGASYSVSGLYFNDSTANSVGLFGSNTGTVQNVGVKDSYFSGNKDVGGVVGYNYGTMTNCSNSGTVTGGSNVGGVVGYNYKTVTECSNSGTVTGSGDYFGGVVGYNYGTITGCTNTGIITGSRNIGGVTGFNVSAVTNCSNSGTVTGSGEYVGGVVGYNGDTVTNCTNSGTVTGSGNRVGGVAGHNYGTITGCSNNGTVTGSGSYFGGVAGYNTGSVTECTNTGSVTGGSYVGGVAGYNSSAVNNCTNGGEVTGSNYFGGVVGSNYGTVTGCTNSGEVTGSGNYVGGVAGANFGTMTNCSNSGTVTGGSNIGGVVGENVGTVTGCTNSGAVTGNDCVSGVVGLNDNGTVSSCYSTGDVSGVSFVSGVVSSNTGTVTNCGNSGAVTGSGSYVSGVVSNNSGGAVTNCYNTGAVTGSSEVSGVVSFNYGTVANCYYDSTVYTGNAFGFNDGTTDKTEGKTTAQFKSGEVAYLLSLGCTVGETTYSGDVWGQTIDLEGETPEDAPVLNGAKVYPVLSCSGAASGYSNTEGRSGGHTYVNGFCKGCDHYEAPEGSGTADDPYQIANAGNLYWFAAVVNGGYDGVNNNEACAILTADIVVNENVLKADGTLNGDGSGFRVWTPIGFDPGWGGFTGTFDGKEFTVSGLYVNDPTAENVGLVGYLGVDCAVSSVGLKDSYFSGKYVAGVVGVNFGTVTDCTNSGSVTGSSGYVGGVVATNYGNLTNCSNSGTVIGGNDVGGVVGYNSGTVTNCTNSGTVTGSDDFVGGVVGENVGTVTGCSNSGTVTNSGDHVGGVVGYNYGTVTDCTNSGAVTGSRNYVGGVVSRNQTDGKVTNCYNIGSVTGNGDSVGGVVGCNFGTVANCYFDSTVYTGTAFGVNDGTTDKTEGKTTAQFKRGEVAYLLSLGCTAGETTYPGDVWGQTIDLEGETPEDYPVLNGAKVYQITDTTYSNYEGTVVYSVTIAWGEMSYTYTDESGWADNGTGWVEVTNDGSADVTVTYAYETQRTDISGSFTDGTNSVSTVTVSAQELKKVLLVLDGKPAEALDAAIIGEVKLTIAEGGGE